MDKYVRRGLELGIYLGLLNAVIIYFSNVVFASNGPDNSGLTVLWALLMFSFIVFFGYRLKASGANSSTCFKASALLAVVAFSIAILAFGIVDNLYLSTVSLQSDKISAFKNSHFQDMRSFINQGLLIGYLFGLPMSSLGGCLAAKIGGLIFAKRHSESAK